jgi:hypothetical protein
MQTIQQLADCFFTKYSEEAIKNDTGAGALSSTMYHDRLCEQVRQLVEYHVTAALKAANENASIIEEDSPFGGTNCLISEESILNAYSLTNIK